MIPPENKTAEAIAQFIREEVPEALISVDTNLPNRAMGWIDGAMIVIYRRGQYFGPAVATKHSPACLIYMGFADHLGVTLKPTDVMVYKVITSRVNYDEPGDSIVYDLNAPESLDAISKRVNEIVTNTTCQPVRSV